MNPSLHSITLNNVLKIFLSFLEWYECERDRNFHEAVDEEKSLAVLWFFMDIGATVFNDETTIEEEA